MTTQTRQLKWVQGLPQIISALQNLLKTKGKDGGNVVGDEEWAERGRYFDEGNLCISEEGYDEGGPYRLRVVLNSTDGSANFEEPLLKLEIRPSPLWLEEVKRLAGGTKGNSNG